MCKAVLTYGWLLDPSNLKNWIGSEYQIYNENEIYDFVSHNNNIVPKGWMIMGCHSDPGSQDFDDIDWMLTIPHVDGMTLDNLKAVDLNNVKLIELMRKLNVEGLPSLCVHHDYQH